MVFKAEIGALSRRVGQIQGVWVHPNRRGRGLGAAGTAAVVQHLVGTGRVASLYVNAFNSVARASYRGSASPRSAASRPCCSEAWVFATYGPFVQ